MGRVLVALLAVVVAACGGPGSDAGPPEIHYGRDLCVQCGMIVSEPRFAAAYRLPDGTERIFDDLGGLLIYGHEHGELDEAEVWVHDVETEAWVRASDAWFVATAARPTPMGYGILAFSDRERAETFAAEVDAPVLTWEELRTIPADEIGVYDE
ncbi:MAG TPA: hypothetical protein ENK55_10525 [Actinobacteria bacterium]|nr:hypothetical protein [Actinomycetota bacterium]